MTGPSSLVLPPDGDPRLTFVEAGGRQGWQEHGARPAAESMRRRVKAARACQPPVATHRRDLRAGPIRYEDARNPSLLSGQSDLAVAVVARVHDLRYPVAQLRGPRQKEDR